MRMGQGRWLLEVWVAHLDDRRAGEGTMGALLCR